jgi:hypothetical protein
MNIKEFKTAFNELAEGVPYQGANSGQWRKLVALVEKLEEEKPIKKSKVTEINE